ncbi:hypothetical protein DPMN_050031 [Dreissena polymorpha]|uniref:Uncharacterized protein n=1 Tax=Dreissena polymorpha TaxID=45954 RepID=A0A9D4CFZ4_DREPO|nr:hypothetical protein DPMN_050031 [Dreissena polymorpha]
MSPRIRLYDRLGSFRALSLSSYGNSCNPGTSFVARRWTFSIRSTCFFKCGAHT